MLTPTDMKPDLCGYTHFTGSGVYAADGGTSAATPVVAGLVGALRSVFPYTPTVYSRSPLAMKNMLMHTTIDKGAVGFDFKYGWGIVNGRRLALLRSMNIASQVDEAAANINELTEEERQLQAIEGLNEVELSWNELADQIPAEEALVSEDSEEPQFTKEYNDADNSDARTKETSRHSTKDLILA